MFIQGKTRFNFWLLTQRSGIAMAGAALSLTALISSAQAADAPAAAAAEAEELTEVVITGTAIRGAAPVGVNLITIGREEIEETGAQSLQQILKGVTAVTGFGNNAQGGFQSFDGAGTFAPTIHGLGGSASNSTLILIDGHRLPLSGINHTLADPNVIAPLAIERVEVLPEGASSTYGSDATAGVLNFITRKNYQGFEMGTQGGYADGHNSYSAGFIWGDVFDRGSLLMSYNYAYQSNLTRGDRPYTLPDQRSQGGGNFLDANCGPASVQVGAVNYLYPYSAPVASSSACSYAAQADLLPEVQRHNVLVKLTRNITDNLEFSTDVVYSKLDADNKVNRGVVQATVFGPGTTGASAVQINPFFTQPTGATGTSQTVRWSADELFGPGARQRSGALSFFVTSSLNYKFATDWEASLGVTAGVDRSRQRTDGTLCTSCALLALNGTTQTGGSLTTPSIVGTSTVVLNTPLTAANALDVWQPAGSNRTSAAIRQRLLDNTTFQIAHQSLKDFKLQVDGPVMAMPGGDLRIAAGAEFIAYTMDEEQQQSLGIGPVSSGARARFFDFRRDVSSFFGEVLVPVIGLSNALPLVRKLDFNLSARRDDYSDFGNTTNPKFAFSWGLTDGFTVRGNVGRSFTAPALTSRGDQNGATAESGYSGIFAAGGAGIPANFQIPISYPGASGLPAGACNTSTGICTIANGTITGLSITGGNKDLKPAKGKSFSFGFDWASQALNGLRVSATYWSAEYIGGITAPQAAFALAAPSLGPQTLRIYPTGATPAQIAALTAGLPQNGELPPTVYFSYSFQQRNAFNLDAAGVDLDVNYAFKTGLGDVDLGLNMSSKVKMEQQFGEDGTAFDILNTSGLNTTFPSNEMSARFNAGLKRNGWSGDLFVNYSGSYTNWSGTAATGNTAWTIQRFNGLWPIGGGQPVDSNTTVDLHLGYKFQGEGSMQGVQVFFDGSNIFDKEPAFYNTATGFDFLNGNVLGRQVTLGISKKW